ncbi:MAG: hypothetical protein ACTSRY_03635, partial [Alphaproteobacteria bacterium]
MKIGFRIALLLAAALVLAVPARTAWAKTNIMFILDVSGSMRQKLDGEPKMRIAKRAFAGLVDGMPSDTHAGLFVYGHHGDKD